MKLANLFQINALADPTQQRHQRTIRNGVIGMILILACLWASAKALHAWDQYEGELDTLVALKEARDLVRNEPSTNRTTPTSARERNWLREINAVGARLNVDWSSRLAQVEQALPSDVLIHSLRLETNKNELIVKGEVDTLARLKNMNDRLVDSGLNARLTRFARQQDTQGNNSNKNLPDSFEFALTLNWTQ